MFHKTIDYYKSVIEMTRVMVAILDLDGKVTRVNANFEDFFWNHRSKLIGKNWFDEMISVEDQKFAKKIFQTEILNQESSSHVSKILTKEDKKLFVEWNYKAIRFPDHSATGVLVVGRDVSERIRNERRLLNERFELIERNKELTCLYGIAQVVENSKATLPEILQSVIEIELIPPAFQFPEITSSRIQIDQQIYSTPGFKKSNQKLTEKLIIQGRKRGAVEIIYSEKHPERSDFEITFLQEEKNLLKTIVGQVALIIEKKEADNKRYELEGQLRHADRLAKIGQLTAGVAHELNEPIGNILGFAQLASKNPDLPEQVYRDLEHIVGSSLHAREIIKKLMLFSRQMPHQKIRFNLNNLVKEGLSFIEPRFAKNNVKFIQDLAPNLPEITADPSQLRQVLVNLVVNAYQAMPNGGILTIKTLSEVDNVIIVVLDTGVGMDQETLGQIFLPFFTTKDVDQGTGLGLSVAHGIITAHYCVAAVFQTLGILHVLPRP
ncbi:MAG: PAS domain S-box protein [Deltaproteobacteria bacterium]|nr:PAS domain S-box protein [Deltaproteobacteria bacterium]